MDLAEFQYSVVDQHSDQHIVVEWPSDLGYPHLTSNHHTALTEWMEKMNYTPSMNCNVTNHHC